MAQEPSQQERLANQMFGDGWKKEEKERLLNEVDKIADCLCALVNVEKERGKTELEILAAIKQLGGPGVPVKGVVTLGKPVSQ